MIILIAIKNYDLCQIIKKDRCKVIKPETVYQFYKINLYYSSSIRFYLFN